MSEPNRRRYIKIARKLTAPLLDAYYAMLDTATNSTTHTPPTSTTTTTTPPHPTHTTHLLSSTTRTILEATHDQDISPDSASRLENLDAITTVHPYTLSDAAYSGSAAIAF